MGKILSKYNDRYTPKTYTFDVTKCDEIFYLLVADGQVAVPNGLKISQLEQRKKRGFCKYHNCLGHKTSHCVLFRDLVQRGLNEGILMFGDKENPHMQVDGDPLKDVDAMYTEVASCNVVEVIADTVEILCWVFVLVVLLLNLISLYVLLEPMFQHVLGIFVRCWIRCSNILTRFSVPGFMPICTRALYCLRKQYFLILLTKQRISLQNQLWNIPKVVFIF
jgi:hypothetical protein